MQEEFRVIPGYEGYEVDCYGRIRAVSTEYILSQRRLNGYQIVSAFRGAATETLSVHRAVALAWVLNPDPYNLTIVNHRDGNPLNNHWSNLEWCNHSQNNYHAVNSGLRNDNIPCVVRDSMDGMVYGFESLSQATVYMGLSRDAPVEQLFPKRFGWLINDRYELKLADDHTPWFYEGRPAPMPPSRYWVVAAGVDGTRSEYFTGKELLKGYQLYDSPYGRSVPSLVKYAEEQFPDIRFELRDSYTQAQALPSRKTEVSRVQPVTAFNAVERLDFRSLSECARHFNVDRSSIQSRLNSGKELGGWTFITSQHSQQWLC